MSILKTRNSLIGLLVSLPWFNHLGLKQQLAHCFRQLKRSPVPGRGLIRLMLIVHLLIGYRRLRDLRYCQDDPMVRRLLEISRLPDVATVSRMLAGMDSRGVDNLRKRKRKLKLQLEKGRRSLQGWLGLPPTSTAL